MCYHGFLEDNRAPKNLPCGHTFCNKCVESLARRLNLQCPECRQGFDEVAITTNFALRDLLVELLASEAPASVIEVIEEHHQNPAPDSAKEWICDGCTLRNNEAAELCSACEMSRPKEILRAGDKVTLQALNTQLYNGQTGQLKFFCYESKRWEVKLAVAIEGKDTIRVKPVNILLGGSSSADREQQGVSSPASPASPPIATAPAQSSGQTIFTTSSRIQVVQAFRLADGTLLSAGHKGRVVEVDVAFGKVWVDFDHMLVFKWVSMDRLKKEGGADVPGEGEADATGGSGTGVENQEHDENEHDQEPPPEQGNPRRWRPEVLFGPDHGVNIQRCPNCLRAKDSENCHCDSPERGDPDHQHATASQQPCRSGRDESYGRGPRSRSRQRSRGGSRHRRRDNHLRRRSRSLRERSRAAMRRRRREDTRRDSRSRSCRRRSLASPRHRGATRRDSRSRSRRRATHRDDTHRDSRGRLR